MKATALTVLSIPLTGAGGEPVSFPGTLGSHGLASLPPNEIGPGARSLRTTLQLADGSARTVELLEEPPRTLAIRVAGRAPGARTRGEIVAAVRTMFALNDDLAPLYRSLAHDAEFAFVAEGGIGRMLRSVTAFEDVVRTICTTNCSWSGTERMISARMRRIVSS